MKFESQYELAHYFWEHPGMASICIENCGAMKGLLRLPSDLKRLTLFCCPDLERLPKLPDTLLALDIRHCPNLASLPTLPQSLKELSISDCDKVSLMREDLKIVTPCFPECALILPDLTDFSLRNCSNVRALPAVLPETLRALAIENCPNLIHLPAIPKALEVLDFGECPRLRIPNGLPTGLPKTLTSLRIWDCPQFSAGPLFIDNLRIDIR